jgi:hypothetical protein
MEGLTTRVDDDYTLGTVRQERNMATEDQLIARRILNRKKRRADAEKALSVAHGAWRDFSLQLAGNTQEERDFNVCSHEFLMSSWQDFAREYSRQFE